MSTATVDYETDPDYQKWSKISTQLLIDSYRENSMTNRIQDHGHRVIEQWRDPDAKGPSLDLGCGFGRHFEFAKQKESLIGYDYNLTSLRFAHDNHAGSTFIRGKIEKLPFPTDSFQTIYALYSLEHVRPLREALKEVKRVLRPHGQFLILLPAEGGFLYNTARKYTTIPYYTKKYEIDYEKVVKMEHCNTAKQVLEALDEFFVCEKSSFAPLKVGGVNANLIVLGAYRHEK